MRNNAVLVVHLPSALPHLSSYCVLQISALGAGLLLGSALAIILPEGFEAAHEVCRTPCVLHPCCRVQHHVFDYILPRFMSTDTATTLICSVLSPVCLPLPYALSKFSSAYQVS